MEGQLGSQIWHLLITAAGGALVFVTLWVKMQGLARDRRADQEKRIQQAVEQDRLARDVESLKGWTRDHADKCSGEHEAIRAQVEQLEGMLTRKIDDLIKDSSEGRDRMYNRINKIDRLQSRIAGQMAISVEDEPE